MAKSQVKGSKMAKKKPPFQRGNGGSITVFTHRRRWRLCHNSRTNETQRHSAALKSAGQSPIGLLQLDRRKLSPVCSGLSQFVPVCPICIQSQNLPRNHGVKFGSRISGQGRAPSRVTVGHEGCRAGSQDALTVWRGRVTDLHPGPCWRAGSPSGSSTGWGSMVEKTFSGGGN